ncbi:T9SS type A sorting domain-containing protein [bacterium]|nr:T9SS type A sorting domain-containing protein [bacterium]
MMKRVSLFILFTMLAVSSAFAYSGGPPNDRAGNPPAFANCTQCHSSFPVNSGNGALDITELFEYTPGETYTLEVNLSDPGQQRWGFELTIYDDGNDFAGEIDVTDNTNTQLNGDFLKHTGNGTYFGEQQGTWSFDWTAPAEGTGEVTIYLAGNAANGNFSTSGDYIYTTTSTISEAAPVMEMQTIPLAANFLELTSLYIEPMDPNAASVFGMIENLGIVYMDNGGIFLPPDLNTIGEVDMTEGYRIFVSEDAELVVEGTPLAPDTEYMVEAGPWNWIGYPHADPMPIESVMGEIADDVVIVITDDGDLWIPPILNTINNMVAGQGYMIIVENDVNFTYEPTVGLASADVTPVSTLPTALDAPAATGLPYAVLVNIDETLRNFNPAAIELYDNSTLVGKSIVDDNFENIPVIAWESAPKYGLDGFTKGNSIDIRLLDVAGNEIAVVANGDLQFGAGAYAIATLEADALPTSFVVGNSYPNPFNPSTIIPVVAPVSGDLGLKVYDVLGRTIYQQNDRVDAGRHELLFDANNAGKELVSGVYFVEVSFQNQRHMQKITLLK